MAQNPIIFIIGTATVLQEMTKLIKRKRIGFEAVSTMFTSSPVKS